MIVYVIEEIGGNENYPDSLNVMVNYHYHGIKRVITWSLPSMAYIQWDATSVKFGIEKSCNGLTCQE